MVTQGYNLVATRFSISNAHAQPTSESQVTVHQQTMRMRSLLPGHRSPFTKKLNGTVSDAVVIEFDANNYLIDYSIVI